MRTPITIGIIGTGKHGSRYAHHITTDLKGLLVLKGICRKSQTKGQKQAADLNVNFFSDYQKIIAAPSIDAIISVTPPHLNRKIADACLTHQKPLLLEKPLSTSLSDAQHIVDSFNKDHLPLTIGQTLRYNMVIQVLKKEFQKIGNPHSFIATHRLEPSTIAWLEDPELAGGGVIFHTAVHVFDALRYITGLEVKRVHASSFSIYNPNLEDLFTAQIEMENGLVGIVESSKVCPARSGRYEFAGSDGQLQGDQIHGFVQFIQGMQVDDIIQTKPAPTLLSLLKDWYAHLSGNAENPITGDEGLAAVKICNACRESSQTQQWVSVT